MTPHIQFHHLALRGCPTSVAAAVVAALLSAEFVVGVLFRCNSRSLCSWHKLSERW